MPFLSLLLGFTNNADASAQLVFGRDMNTWLIYTLIFLGLTMLSFIWVWLTGLIRDRKDGTSIQEPWD